MPNCRPISWTELARRGGIHLARWGKRNLSGAQLADLPEENLIFQPVNLDTTAGILLPLAHVSHRDPDSVVAVFPSDHFIRDEKSFLRSVTKAVLEVEKHPDALVLLGVAPEGPDEGYGWIEASGVQGAEESLEVCAFWEKPDAKQARRLMLRGSLWNTFVFAARAEVLWKMVSLAAPEPYCIFSTIRLMLPDDHARSVIEFAYRALRPMSFSSAILSQLSRISGLFAYLQCDGAIGGRKSASLPPFKKSASLRTVCSGSGWLRWKTYRRARSHNSKLSNKQGHGQRRGQPKCLFAARFPLVNQLTLSRTRGHPVSHPVAYRHV